MFLDGLSQCQGYCWLMIGYELLVCMWLILVINDWDCYNMWKCIYILHARLVLAAIIFTELPAHPLGIKSYRVLIDRSYVGHPRAFKH